MTAAARKNAAVATVRDGSREAQLLVDFGSTYTKVSAVDVAEGRSLGLAAHETTIERDIMEGFDAASTKLDGSVRSYASVRVAASSSAGGGLRIGVVGLEEELTAEAARRAALTAGARVVILVSGGLRDDEASAMLAEAAPDIVLLAGGTNGGNAECLIQSAAVLARRRLDVPIVLAGNETAQQQAADILDRAGRRVVRVANVMPEIGVISEDPIRELLRELFIRHVIGGKNLSSSSRFPSLVRMATPDAVLKGAEVLSRGLSRQGKPGGVVVVDVGGATTDVHSVIAAASREDVGYKRPLIRQSLCARTVEGDLGLRWNAEGIVEVAARHGLLTKRAASELAPAAALRALEPAYVPEDDRAQEVDLVLARLAVTVALRRHTGTLAVTLSPDGATLDRRGRDLRDARLVVGTGGIFCHAGEGPLDEMLRAALAAAGDGQRLLPAGATVVLDRSYSLGAAGLLALESEEAAWRLLNRGLFGGQEEAA
jgi:uncharacterized protein (TIGR01319 family)